jgi:hypothetical protein
MIAISPILISLVVGLFIAEAKGVSIRDIISALIAISAFIIVALLLNQIFPYQKRTYHLTRNKLVISKGRTTKEYQWSDFEYFFSALRMKSWLGEINKESKAKMGGVYYLRKRSRFPKIFVIVYSEPENDREVVNFLSDHLEKREISALDGIGLISYKFK